MEAFSAGEHGKRGFLRPVLEVVGWYRLPFESRLSVVNLFRVRRAFRLACALIFQVLEQRRLLDHNYPHVKKALRFQSESWGMERWLQLSKPFSMDIDCIHIDETRLAEVRAVIDGPKSAAQFFQEIEKTDPNWSSSRSAWRLQRTQKLLSADPSTFVVAAKIEMDGTLTVLNGHHRCAIAFLTGKRTIQVYLASGARWRVRE